MEFDGEGKNKPLIFNVANIMDPFFEAGMLLSNKIKIRKAIHSHAIKTKRNLKITENDHRRVYARCVEKGCEWRITQDIQWHHPHFQQSCVVKLC